MRSLLNHEYNGHKRSGHGARLVKIRLVATVVAILDTIVYMTIICARLGALGRARLWG